MRRLLAMMVLMAACEGDSGEETPTSDGGTTLPASTSSTSDTSSSSSTAIDSSSGGGPTYAPALPTCRRECDLAADCCPAGLDACPSPQYPGNFGCENGMCVPATCVGDAECDTVIAGSVCTPLHGIAQCVTVCEDEAACAPLGSGFGCGGATGEGQSYCYERCDLGPPCPLDTCNPDGVCVCAGTDECISGYRCDIDE